jgi:hypothetical protein
MALATVLQIIGSSDEVFLLEFLEFFLFCKSCFLINFLGSLIERKSWNSLHLMLVD